MSGWLEVELRGQLHGASWLRIAVHVGCIDTSNRCDGAELPWSVGEITVRIGEVRMVESVEGFQTQLQIALTIAAQGDILCKFQVRVVEAWSMEEVPLHIAEGTESLW